MHTEIVALQANCLFWKFVPTKTFLIAICRKLGFKQQKTEKVKNTYKQEEMGYLLSINSKQVGLQVTQQWESSDLGGVYRVGSIGRGLQET